MIMEAISLDELNDRAMKVLTKELGIADSIRFIRQFSVGQGDYTRDRKKLFQGLSLDDLVKEIEQKHTKRNMPTKKNRTVKAK